MTDDMTKRRAAALRAFEVQYGTYNLGAYNGFKAGWDACQAEMQAQVDAWKQNCLEQVEKVNELAVELSDARAQLKAKDAVIDVALTAIKRVVNHLKDEAEPEQVVICKEALEQIQKMNTKHKGGMI